VTVNPVAARLKDKRSFVVCSGDFDKVLVSVCIIVTGAVAMGDEVSVFFTFWALNALRRPDAPDVDKSLLDKAFMSFLTPSGRPARDCDAASVPGRVTSSPIACAPRSQFRVMHVTHKG
jgi:peroxiredoxin family protein